VTGHTIYTSGPAGLQRSDDSGQTFRVVVPLPGQVPAVLLPSSPQGTTRILLVAQRPLIYDGSSGMVTPGPSLPVGVVDTADAAVAGGDLLVTALQPDASSPNGVDPVVVRCPDLSSCSTSLVARADSVLHLSSGAGIVFAYSPTHLYSSQDGGRSFRASSVDGGWNVATLAVAPPSDGNEVIVGGSLTTTTGRQESVIVRSPATSSTISLSNAPAAFTWAVNMLQVLPDGRILAAMSGGSGTDFGLRCSTDGGGTWKVSC
jgi:hypothetical protein